ncbi:hypothetical protein, partial [Shewanella algae]|uniref:hypothetical protein n=1 Tax=Shewanella algae TaxID=38313 RepID=UPI001C92422E
DKTSSPNARSMPNRKPLFYNNIQTHSRSTGNFLPEPGQFFARRAISCPKELPESRQRPEFKSGHKGGQTGEFLYYITTS